MHSYFVPDTFSSSDVITMMQIDCTVTDTRVLYMKEKDIPAHLKSQPLKNAPKANTSYLKQGTSKVQLKKKKEMLQ